MRWFSLSRRAVGSVAAWVLAAALGAPVSAAAQQAEERGAPSRFQAPLGPESAPGREAPRVRRPAADPRAVDRPPAALRHALRDAADSQELRRMRRWVAPVRRLVEDTRSEESGDAALAVLAALLLGLVGGPLAVFVLVPLLRGKGDLSVSLGYPDELEGTFRVRLSRRRPKTVSRSRGVKVDPGADRAATRYDHPMVSRETRFQRIAARTWWVRVEGILHDGENDQVLDTRILDEKVRVRRGKTARLALDLKPEHCPVEVKVLWDRRPVREASVAIHGAPGSVRFARGGTVQLKLARGAHTLVVGSGDRVAEHGVDVGSYRATWAVVDLGAGDGLLFKGCPPAVEPYLQGDYAGAARALEREGQAKVAHVLLARLDQEHGRSIAAAEHFEAADRLVEAAELWAAEREFERSATLFDRAGKLERAAEMYRAAGELLAAGGAYERAEEWSQAASCYREAGDVPRLTGALEQLGSYFEAAELAMGESDWSRAIRNLQHVAPGDARYQDAARLAVRAFREIGDPELAARKLDDVVHNAGPEGPPLDIQFSLAEALEESGDVERALKLYETVRDRDESWPGVFTRIETLRKKVSHSRNATVGHTPTSPGRRLDTTGFNRYELLEEIGRGGMGVVYKARDRRLGRIVALKKLPENLRDHPKAVELFLREARAAAALNHPNIVTLFDADEEDGTFFITMELLEGQNLYTILRRVERIKPRDVARLGVQVSAGLNYAHDHRIVHRDVKTANLFFTKDKVLKVMDFGLAKMVEEVRRAVTVVAGTPYYMAPEQSAGEQVDHRADLYALGVTLFELATGTLPFEQGDVAFHHRNTPPPDPRERGGDVPDALARLCLDLMAKDPEARPESAAEVAERLQAILAQR